MVRTNQGSARKEPKGPMSPSISGGVALITGTARGQGRAHAVRLSAEGADIIALDLAGPLPSSVPYESPTPDDLAETARLVRANDRGVITAAVDVRDLDALQTAVDQAVGELGRLDVVVANAGICSPAPWDRITAESFRDTIDTNVTGTWNTVMATARHIIDGGRGGSIILTGSAAGIKVEPFMVHYVVSKHAVTGMARAFAAELGRRGRHPDGQRPDARGDPVGRRLVSLPARHEQTTASRRHRPTRGHRRRRRLAGLRPIQVRHRNPGLG
jgi:NAD(P)-dependent dehydrogenase (short-subunit alcohol dehydrogenase family)